MHRTCERRSGCRFAPPRSRARTTTRADGELKSRLPSCARSTDSSMPNALSTSNRAAIYQLHARWHTAKAAFGPPGVGKIGLGVARGEKRSRDYSVLVIPATGFDRRAWRCSCVWAPREFKPLLGYLTLETQCSAPVFLVVVSGACERGSRLATVQSRNGTLARRRSCRTQSSISIRAIVTRSQRGGSHVYIQAPLPPG